jgi:hypothetical protein
MVAGTPSNYLIPCRNRRSFVRSRRRVANLGRSTLATDSRRTCASTRLLEGCIARMLGELKRRNPVLGWDVAVPRRAGANARTPSSPTPMHRGATARPSRRARAEASTATACTWRCARRRTSRLPGPSRRRGHMKRSRSPRCSTSCMGAGIDPQTCATDKGYDTSPGYDACAERGVLPVVPLRQTTTVKRGEHKPPFCEHGEWRFAGADRKRNACKWRCPTGECKPASIWIKADRLHPLIPREALRWKGLYRRRASVERAFGQAQDRMGARAVARASHRARATSRRPHDSSQLACALNRAEVASLAA